MMEHPSDGQLQAYVDDEALAVSTDRVERHVLTCRMCQERISRLRTLEADVARALSILDPQADPGRREAVRWNVRRERARRRSGRHRRRLAAAAVVLLFGAGAAAAALPGSPVRAWLAGSDDPATAVEVTTPQDEVGLRVELQDGAARVELEELSGDVGIQVRLVPGRQVEIAAPAGASFQTRDGWVRVAGADAGTVRVGFPTATRVGELVVEGVTRVRVDGGTLQVNGAPVTRPDEWDDAGWIPVVPAHSGGGGGRNRP